MCHVSVLTASYCLFVALERLQVHPCWPGGAPDLGVVNLVYDAVFVRATDDAPGCPEGNKCVGSCGERLARGFSKRSAKRRVGSFGRRPNKHLLQAVKPTWWRAIPTREPPAAVSSRREWPHARLRSVGSMDVDSRGVDGRWRRRRTTFHSWLGAA